MQDRLSLVKYVVHDLLGCPPDRRLCSSSFTTRGMQAAWQIPYFILIYQPELFQIRAPREKPDN